jgi:hypothetical protein
MLVSLVLAKRTVFCVKLTKAALKQLILRFEPGILWVGELSPSSFFKVALKVQHLYFDKLNNHRKWFTCELPPKTIRRSFGLNIPHHPDTYSGKTGGHGRESRRKKTQNRQKRQLWCRMTWIKKDKA